MAHHCQKFACTECQAPATHLHTLPTDLQKVIAGYHKTPRLEIKEGKGEEKKLKMVEYEIKSGDRLKYYHRICFACVDLKSKPYRYYVLESLADFPKENRIKSCIEHEGEDTQVVVPGISVGVDKNIHVGNEYECVSHIYSLKYLPAFTAMLADIEKRLLIKFPMPKGIIWEGGFPSNSMYWFRGLYRRDQPLDKYVTAEQISAAKQTIAARNVTEDKIKKEEANELWNRHIKGNVTLSLQIKGDFIAAKMAYKEEDKEEDKEESDEE